MAWAFRKMYVCPASVDSIAYGSRNTLLVKDSLGYFASKIVPGFFGLISVPVFVRLIGVEEYGRLAVILPVLMALASFGSGWLQQAILRFHPAPEGSSQSHSDFRYAVSAGAFYSCLLLALVLLPILHFLRCAGPVWLIAEVYCLFQLLYTVRLSRWQAQLQPHSVLKNEALRSAATFFLPVLLVFVTGRRSFPVLLLGLALGYGLPLLFNGRSQRPGDGLRFVFAGSNPEGSSQEIVRRLWSFGWAVGAWLMLCQLLPVAGRSAIQRYSGYAQAGIYASLYELAVRCFSLFASPVMQAAHPRIMLYWNRGEYDAARSTIRRSIQIQTLMFVPIAAAGVVFARPLTRLILGAHTPAPAFLLPLLMLGGFLWQIALLAHKPLEILQRTNLMLGGMLLVLLIEVAGNFLLVPRYGLASAVYVFVAGATAYIGFALGCGHRLLAAQHATFRHSPSLT